MGPIDLLYKIYLVEGKFWSNDNTKGDNVKDTRRIVINAIIFDIQKSPCGMARSILGRIDNFCA